MYVLTDKQMAELQSKVLAEASSYGVELFDSEISKEILYDTRKQAEEIARMLERVYYFAGTGACGSIQEEIRMYGSPLYVAEAEDISNPEAETEDPLADMPSFPYHEQMQKANAEAADFWLFWKWATSQCARYGGSTPEWWPKWFGLVNAPSDFPVEDRPSLDSVKDLFRRYYGIDEGQLRSEELAALNYLLDKKESRS